MNRNRIGSLLLALALIGSPVAPVSGCPMCKAANDADQDGERNTKPQAYMWSILFMLSMPATLLGAFGYAFWRMQRNSPSVLDESDAAA